MGSLNPHQFSEHGEQLAMFMTPDEVVNDVHKIDSERYFDEPADQWEDVRRSKLGAAYARGYVQRDQSNIPPLHIEHVGAWEGYWKRNADPQTELWDGHHRLATAQEKGLSLVPVIHHDRRSDLHTSHHDMRRTWGIEGYHR